MILKIAPGLIRKALPDGQIVPVVKDRPNLPEIDLAKVRFLKVQVRSNGSSTIKWTRLVAFMERQLRKGFLTLGTREFMAIFCSKRVDKWLEKYPGKSPWILGSGGLIGFPDGLVKMPGKRLSYDVALWIPSEGWHVRVFDADDEGAYPNWHSYLRLPVYPIKG